MNLFKGITITLHEKSMIGRDEFNHPIYQYIDKKVENVLIEPITQTDIVNQTDLRGRKLAYRLCIPKGDNHQWEGNDVTIYNQRFKVYGPVEQYIEKNLPLQWNKKVLVERYE
ncbi:hypothetical protein ACR75P_05195 [Faecalicoccus pleomorphus]|uniref:hypothetical protein n=1 Tax=Faecalicoccus pleomorphus TaxID=1323 RepID=UPI003DA585F4